MTREEAIDRLHDIKDSLSEIERLVANGNIDTEKDNDEVAYELSVAWGTVCNVLTDGFEEFA